MRSQERHAHMVVGNAGAGKSTFARQLAAHLGAALIDIDTVTERLVRLVLHGHGLDPDDRDSPAYKQLLRDPVYEVLFDVALDNLPHTACVIVGPFTAERRRPGWPGELQRRLDATVHVYHVVCDVAERRRRLEQRGCARDRGKLNDFESYAALGVDPTPLPFEHQCIDTSRSHTSRSHIHKPSGR